jgi:uncharacterized repeat protein (TIGR02543 family)
MHNVTLSYRAVLTRLYMLHYHTYIELFALYLAKITKRSGICAIDNFVWRTLNVLKKEHFMKNSEKLLGFAAIVAVIGFSFIACDDGNGGTTGTAPTVTTASLPNGTVGTAYSQTLTATGDTPITWSIDTGSLPDGLTLSTAGVIAGTPTTAGTSNFTVKATNATGSGTKALSIVIAPSGSGGDPDLSGTISISPNTDVEINTELTATYSGSETISFQWKKDGGNVGTNSNKYTPTEAGSYTVTVSATGYNPKTSDPVTVTAPAAPITYTVTFNADGGSPAPVQQKIASGGKVTEPAAMTKTGYAFDGWYKEAGLANKWNFASDTVTADITLYAKWTTAITVTFDKNGGDTEADPRTIALVPPATTIGSLPQPPTRALYTFSGWNTQANGSGTSFDATTTVSSSITVYAQWQEGNTVPGATLAAKLTWLQTNAQSNGGYTLEVNADEIIGVYNLLYSGKNNITVTLRGIESNRTVNLSSNGSMFTVGSGVTLILDNNITLQGRTANNASVVRVNSGGTLYMNNGSAIKGNYVSSASNGGGVFVNGGTFTMNGGEISGNTAVSFGGGVYVGSGTFTMNGGTVSGNTARGSGGGVYVPQNGGTFILSGGTVSGNTTNGNGGGVEMRGGTFTMNNGAVSNNTADIPNGSRSGGGVYVDGGTFTMSGGTISGNTSSQYGGGVNVRDGTFTMSGGTVSGNTARTSGGGVYVYLGSFTKTGGTVTGYSSDAATGNVVKSSSGTVQNSWGHAVYAEGGTSVVKRMETTAGPEVNLSWNGNNNSPIFSGNWE